MDNLLYTEEITIDKCIMILDERFKNKQIYTGLGDILLSINPYQYFRDDENIYSLKNKDTVHLFRTIEKVYNGILEGESQTIIVSGESGSGKTETVKQIIHFLNNYSSVDNLLEKIEASCLVLEMFGNASTEKNHNSSRFGKFIELYYQNAVCVGMTTSIYLLEKPRVLNKEPAEKFHVFNRDFIEIKILLEKAGFNLHQIDFISKIIKIVNEIVHLEYGSIIDPMYKELLTKKNMNIQDDIIEKIYNETEFKELRDTLAMKLYDFLFLWIVQQMNIFYNNVETTGLLKIGILDIFGFENLKKNSLEQLCINYANEILQGLLNKILIEDKIKLYRDEEITINNIIPVLNNEQIDLIERIFITLDEECMLPKGNNIGFLQKLNLLFSNHKFFSTQKITIDKSFEIEHYAGKIEYNVNNFLNVNLDRLNLDIDNFITQLFTEVGLNTKKKRGIGKLKINSITNQFRNNLDDFIQNIKVSHLHFIKCIKPNNNEQPMKLIQSIVKEQLVYNGVIQLITILKEGYSYHFNKQKFYKDYGDYILDSDNEYVLGKSRIFLTEEYYKTIKNRYTINRFESIIILQKYSKSMLQLNIYHNIKKSLYILQNILWSTLLQKDYHINRSAFRIQTFFKILLYKQDYLKKLALHQISRYIKTKCITYQYHKKLVKIDRLISIIKKNIVRNFFCNMKNSIIKIQLWWKNYMRKKNDLQKQNMYLEETIIQRDRKIIFLEQRIIELEQRLSRTYNLDKSIIHERDHYIVSLKKDIGCYQKNIEERLLEKIELMDTIDKLKNDNRILIHQLAYLKNKNSLGWISRFFN